MERNAVPFSIFHNFRQQSNEPVKASLGPVASSLVVPHNKALRVFESSADCKETEVTVLVCPRKFISEDPVLAHQT